MAETFVRQHIRMLAPGRTAVIYFKGNGESVRDVPSLRVPAGPTSSGCRSLVNLLAHGYAGAITGSPAQKIIRFFRDNKVQCVLAEFGQTACALVPVCRQAGVPLYAFFHGQDASAGGRSFKTRYSYRRMARSAMRVFAQSESFSKTVEKAGVPRGKIVVSPSGLDVDRFSPSPFKDPWLILAVGRMVEKKAPHLTVQSFARATRVVPEARLEMIGDGPLLARTQETARSLGVEGKVIFHGARDNEFVREKMAKAALFVQHSVTASNGDTESLGITLLEAMACETPVVATRHNGFVETVVDGETGYLVEEHDVDTMADRVVELMSDPKRRGQMGQAGRRHVIANFEAGKRARHLRGLLGLPDGITHTTPE